MASTTTNLGLHKIDLNDAPPDITVLNQNWDKIDELLDGSWSKTAGIIDSNDDLNDYSEIGVYTYSAGTAATLVNVPETSQGTLLVLPRLVNNDSNNIIQVIVTRENSIYVRNKYDGTWKEWDKVASESTLEQRIGNHGRHVPDNCAQISDWNTATKTGWYMGNNASNAPTNYENSSGSLWYFGYVIAHNENYVFQEVYLFTASTEAIEIPKYIRAKKDGTWGSWKKVTVQRDVPADAKLDYIKTLTGDAQVQLDNRMYAKPSFIEFNTTSDMGHGGYLDFHYNGSTDDWTTRIMEEKSGQLRIIADKLRLSGVLDISDGDAGVYGDDHTINLVSKSDSANDYKRSIQLMNKAYEADIADALILIDKDSSGSRNYKLFGEHNPDTLATAIQSLIDSGVISMSAVKSVQRGLIPAKTTKSGVESLRLLDSNTPYTYYVDVEISEVDINKSFVVIDCYSEDSYEYNAIAKLLNGTTIRVYYSTSANNTSSPAVMRGFTWQVVEYA